jgi:signal transduction histidine kinase/CheY-like chemotaxis protein
MHIGASQSARAADQLLCALELELGGQAESFQRALEELFENAIDAEEYCVSFENAIACLRAHLSGLGGPKLEDLWHAARNLVTLYSRRGQVRRRIELDNEYLRVLVVNRHLWRAVDLASLKQAMIETMRSTGISTALFSRYPDATLAELEPWVCMIDGLPSEPPSNRFASHLLIPPGLLKTEGRYSRLVFPLLREGQPWGLAVFDYAAGAGGFQVLQDQLSIALNSIGLHQELLDKTMLHERSVRERQATAERMGALSVLAGGVAHDLNNVLGPLVALPEVILNELGGVDPTHVPALADLRADVESIKSASLRASQTIKDLLTLGRQGRTGKELLDLNFVVADCLSIEPLRFMQDALKRVSVTFELCREPLVIRASEAHLLRAIANLVRNALEAIEGRGRVIVATHSARIDTALSGYETVDPGNYAMVTVSDTGHGISASELTRIFEPFYSKKRVQENSGSGLGLAIVHGVVKDHAGFLDVKSLVGQGTTFTLYFPRLSEVPKEHAKLLLAPGGHAKILIVDDEPIQLRTARRVLGQLGYQVDTLSSGAEACRIFTEYDAQFGGDGREPQGHMSAYDLVIVDMTLNEALDGVAVIQYIQSLFPNQRAMIASGYVPSKRAEAAIERGLIWLAKPYTTNALARAVKDALTGPSRS